MKDLKYNELLAIVNETYLKSKYTNEGIKKLQNSFDMLLDVIFKNYKNGECDYDEFMNVVSSASKNFSEFLRRLNEISFKLDDLTFQTLLTLKYTMCEEK